MTKTSPRLEETARRPPQPTRFDGPYMQPKPVLSQSVDKISPPKLQLSAFLSSQKNLADIISSSTKALESFRDRRRRRWHTEFSTGGVDGVLNFVKCLEFINRRFMKGFWDILNSRKMHVQKISLNEKNRVIAIVLVNRINKLLLGSAWSKFQSSIDIIKRRAKRFETGHSALKRVIHGSLRKLKIFSHFDRFLNARSKLKTSRSGIEPTDMPGIVGGVVGGRIRGGLESISSGQVLPCFDIKTGEKSFRIFRVAGGFLSWSKGVVPGLFDRRFGLEDVRVFHTYGSTWNFLGDKPWFAVIIAVGKPGRFFGKKDEVFGVVFPSMSIFIKWVLLLQSGGAVQLSRLQLIFRVTNRRLAIMRDKISHELIR